MLTKRNRPSFNQLPRAGLVSSLAGAVHHSIVWKGTRGLAMAGICGLNSPSNLRIEIVCTHKSASCLEIDARMPSEVEAISPLVDRLIRLIEGSLCIPGNELHIELAMREAIKNAVVHGNRLDPGKLVQVHCRCEIGKGIFIVVKD